MRATAVTGEVAVARVHLLGRVLFIAMVPLERVGGVSEDVHDSLGRSLAQEGPMVYGTTPSAVLLTVG